MAYFEVEPGVKLYYEQFGTGNPFVFIHGGGGSHELWEQQVYNLADNFQTITFDLRGHGESDKPAHGHTIESFLHDLEALLDHIGVRESINLVCHGIGGYVGILYALKKPETLSRLVLVNSGARFVGQDEKRGGFSTELRDNYTSHLALNKIEARKQLVEQTFFYTNPGQGTIQAAVDMINEWPVYAEKMLLKNMRNLNLESQLCKIQIPTFILHGIHDTKQRFTGAEYLKSKIINSKLIPFKNSAHNPQLEEVEKFNRTLREIVV